MATADPKGDGQKKSVNGVFSGGRLRPAHNLAADYVGVQFSSLPKIAIAIWAWFYTVDMDAASVGYDYASDGWVAKIFLRDLFLMVIVAGGWDWLLYFSPLKVKLAAYKFNPTYPTTAQFARDAFWTLSATLLASVQEVVLMRWWASGEFKHAMFGTPPANETVPTPPLPTRPHLAPPPAFPSCINVLTTAASSSARAQWHRHIYPCR